MIWNEDKTNETSAHVLTAHMVSKLVSSCRLSGSARDVDVTAVGRALAQFLDEHREADLLPTDYWILLVSRALWAIGADDCAREWGEMNRAELNLTSPCVEAIARGGVAMSTWRWLLPTHLVRPIVSELQAGDILWVIDVGKVSSIVQDLECSLFRALNGLLDTLADAWDNPRRRELVGLRHVQHAASAILRCAPGHRKSAALVGEVYGYCREKLDSIRAHRRWSRVPELWLLDL